MRTDFSIARVPAAVTAFTGLMLVAACSSESSPAASPGASASSTTTSSPPPSPSSSPSSSSAAPLPSATSSSAASSSGGVFSGTRQVYLLPKNSESGVAVLGNGKLGLSEAFDDSALFVLTRTSPEGDQYWIRTAKIRKGGEALCVSAKAPAVTTVACDAAAPDQLFRFRETGESNGKPTYTIRTGKDTYIIQDPTGEIAGTGTGVAAVTIGEGTPDIDTPFLLPDRGQATMPALD
ncbi:hypothetical protein ACQP2X_21500 [Actinoplanes sp. CA-131856]